MKIAWRYQNLPKVQVKILHVALRSYCQTISRLEVGERWSYSIDYDICSNVLRLSVFFTQNYYLQGNQSSCWISWKNIWWVFSFSLLLFSLPLPSSLLSSLLSPHILFLFFLSTLLPSSPPLFSLLSCSSTFLLFLLFLVFFQQSFWPFFWSDVPHEPLKSGRGKQVTVQRHGNTSNVCWTIHVD